MSERELLEAAAKAAGMDLMDFVWEEDGFYRMPVGSGFWNPLTDDGDAFKLMVKLNLTVWPVMDSGRPPRYAVAQSPGYPNTIRVEELHNDDPLAATRRAIVRAAAAMGEKK